MPGTSREAAQIAEACVNNRSAEYALLSSLMCWDAVLHCAMLAGVITQERYKSLKGKPEMLASTDDLVIPDAGGMANLPPGHAIVFYENRDGKATPIHAMISTGGGKAAGNKNDCVGVGHSVGWEVLNLATGLKWEGGAVSAPRGTKDGKAVTRAVEAHHRDLTKIG